MEVEGLAAGTVAPATDAIQWEQLYVQLRPTLARALVAATGSYEGVDDAIQEAFVAALHRGGAALQRPEGWLYAVALNRIRRQKRRARILSSLRLRPMTLGQDVDDAIRRTDLVRDLQRLPPRDRELLVAKYYLGLTQDEIAAAMKMPRGTVASLIHRAVARFRDLDGT